MPLWHPSIINLYIGHYSDKEVGFPDKVDISQLDQHMEWFASSSFQVLNELSDPKYSKTHRFLTYLHGLRTPYLSLPFRPTPDELAVIKQISRAAKTDHEIMMAPEQASSFSLFLVAPFCVDFAVGQDFSRTLMLPTFSEKVFLSGQDTANKKLLPYFTVVREVRWYICDCRGLH